METIESIKKELAHYHKLFGVGDYDPSLRGYRVLISQLEQQNAFLENFKIANTISQSAKDDPTYTRAMDLVEKMPKMISAINSLKLELKIEYNPEEGVQKIGATSPQSILKSGL